MPEAAPFVYPQLHTLGVGEMKGMWKRSSAFVMDYLDRRAQAANYYADWDSKLSSKPHFESSMADPGSGLYMATKTDRAKLKMRRREVRRQQRANGPPRGPDWAHQACAQTGLCLPSSSCKSRGSQ